MKNKSIKKTVIAALAVGAIGFGGVVIADRSDGINVGKSKAGGTGNFWVMNPWVSDNDSIFYRLAPGDPHHFLFRAMFSEIDLNTGVDVTGVGIYAYPVSGEGARSLADVIRRSKQQQQKMADLESRVTKLEATQETRK